MADQTEVPEDVDTPTGEQPPAVLTTKAPRSDAQKVALARAREKAVAVRAQNAALKKKELEVERALLQKAKADRAAKIESDYEALSQPPVPPVPTRQAPIAEPASEPGSSIRERSKIATADEPAKPRKRKPARRVVVTEVSSASESEASDVEVVLPRARKKPTPEELQYERAMSKMFSYA
jgi:hypothetical protein